MSEGIPTLADAFRTATEEAASGDAAVTDPALPAEKVESETVTEQAKAGDDQPESTPDLEDGSDPDLQGLIDTMVDESGEGKEAEADKVAEFLKSDDFANTTVTVTTVDGPQSVTIAELSEGYMRQSDYTKKTQEVANDRKVSKDAMAFYEAFMSDPQQFSYELAVRSKVMDETDTPVGTLEVAEFKTPAEAEAELAAKVEERLKADPRFKDAEVAAAQQRVTAEFGRIEGEHGVKIPDALRQSLIDEAAQRGTGDLELVFLARVATADKAQARSSEKRRAAPARPTRATGGDSGGDSKDVINTVADAFKLARIETAANE